MDNGELIAEIVAIFLEDIPRRMETLKGHVTAAAARKQPENRPTRSKGQRQTSEVSSCGQSPLRWRKPASRKYGDAQGEGTEVEKAFEQLKEVMTA